MKKVMFLMAVASMFAFAACEKNEVWSDLDPKTIDPSAIWQQHDRWNQPGTIDGGLLTLTCDNHFGYQQYQGEYQSSCIYRMSGMNRPAVAEQLNGCYSVDTNSHELVAADGTRPGVNINHLYDTIEVAELEGDPHHTNFASYLTPCHAELIQLCFDTTNHKVVGHYRDEHGNSLTAEGEWWGVQTRVVVVHDTVEHHTTDTVIITRTDTVEVNVTDTVRQVIYDTVYEYRYDTINDTVIRTIVRIDSVVTTITRNINYVDQHTSWDSVRVITGGCRVWGTNTVTYVVSENGSEVSRGTQPWRHYSDFSISGIAGVNFPTSVNGGVFNVNTTTGAASVGGHTVTATNTGNHVYGTVMVNGFNMTSYLVPCEPIAYQWSFNAPNATLAFRDVHGHPAGTYNTPYNTDTPTRRLVSADTAYTHLSTNPTGVWSTVASTITWSCNNRRTITRHYNLAPVTETDTYNFSIGFPYVVTVAGSAVAGMLGSTVTISGGVASFTAGGSTLTVTLTAQPRQCTITPIPLPCQHQLTTATLTSNGSAGYKVVVHGTLEGTATTGEIPVAATPRQEVSRDTVWATCGQVTNTVRNGASHTINHTIVRTGIETIHYNVAPLTETHTVSETTHYVSNYSVSGSALTTAQGTTATFSGNSLTIGGATLIITPGAQPWCNLTYNSATLTSAGFVVSFTYNSSNGTVTIPVTWNTPDPVFDGALWAMVTDSYTTNLSTTPEKWVHVIRQHGTGSTATYTWYYTQWRSGLSRADFDSVSVTASQITALQSAITAGRALAKVYHHSDGGATFELGTVKGIQQSSGRWKVKYYDMSGALENMIEFSASTFSNYFGEDPIRGIMTASGQLTADGITMQVF